jgi:hypothetical protein
MKKSISLAEFKERIAQIVHPGQTAGVAVKETNQTVVRKPSDRGYYPKKTNERNHRK